MIFNFFSYQERSREGSLPVGLPEYELLRRLYDTYQHHAEWLQAGLYIYIYIILTTTENLVKCLVALF